MVVVNTRVATSAPNASREVFKRGASPSSLSLPLSFEGEGDKGGEVDNMITASTWTIYIIYLVPLQFASDTALYPAPP